MSTCDDRRPPWRSRTHRKPTRTGSYRWYNEYALPDGYGQRSILVRLDTTANDDRQRFNRAENVRAIAPSDVDFATLYGLRNAAESINRGIDDSLYLRAVHLHRARSGTSLSLAASPVTQERIL